MNVPSQEEFDALALRVQQLSQQLDQLRMDQKADQWLDNQQARSLLNCSQSTLDRMRRCHKIAFRFEGRKPLYEALSVHQYIQQQRIDTYVYS